MTDSTKSEGYKLKYESTEARGKEKAFVIDLTIKCSDAKDAAFAVTKESDCGVEASFTGAEGCKS